MTRTIGDVSKLSGLTVRALRHYDSIGLVKPSTRRTNGYRVYSDSDLERLRRVLVYRELGLGLDEIRRILDDERDVAASMLAERTRAIDRIAQLGEVVWMLDDAISVEREGATMSAEERLATFGSFDPKEHEAEAVDRWAGTDEYTQSTKRTSSYTAQDWSRIKDEESSIYGRFLELMADGVSAQDPRTAQVVDEHRAHISRWYYTCTEATHAGLGQMYVSDERFAKNIDKSGAGLASYMSMAIAARYS